MMRLCMSLMVGAMAWSGFLLGTGDTFAQSQSPARGSSLRAKESCETYWQKKKKNRRLPARPDCEETPEEPADALASRPDAVVDKASDHAQDSDWLPAWPSPDFDWHVGPLVGLKYSTEKDGAGNKTTTTTSEIGLVASMEGVPLWAGNPGLYLEPSVGAAWGSLREESQKADGSKTDMDGSQQRYYANVNLIFLKAFYRHTLGLGYGEITTKMEDQPKVPVRGIKVTNDMAVLLKPWWSAHYTLGYQRGYGQSYAQVYMEDVDHWLHARFFTTILRVVFDTGPGFATAKEYAPTDKGATKIASGNNTYWQLLASVRPFWKIVLDAQAKYIISSSSDKLGNYPDFRYPDQGLYETTRVALPSDSLVSSYFIGLERLVAGLGVGYRINQTILHANEKEGRTRRTFSDQGVVVTYQTGR